MNEVIKTLLYSYPSFDGITEATDRLVYYKALSSYKDNAKTCNQMNEIAALNERAARVVWAKGIIDKLLNELTPFERQLIEYKYFNREQGVGFDTSSRAYFRKQLRLEKKITAALAYLKPNEDWFFENFGDVYFLKAKYLRIKAAAENGRKNAAKERNI